ncbi:MAG: M23 family metallopeptidase [SAR324 cluster bacterium]|nr:M23 family metallopeptidase [SAR324 cluster bacterium]
MKVAQSERDFEEHLQFVKSKEETIDQISQKIRSVTGVIFRTAAGSTKSNLPKKSGNWGRGGPTMEETFSMNSRDSLIQSRLLRQTIEDSAQYYDEAVSDFEKLSLSIENNYATWRNTPTILPVKSRLISDDYGTRMDPFTKETAFHGGTDFAVKTGGQINAPADGVVTRTGDHSGYGLLVEVKHGYGIYPHGGREVRYVTRYGHLSKILVHPGQRVKRGDVIALAGSTGRSTGPHLHYEIIVNGRHINPMSVISQFGTPYPLYRKQSAVSFE